MAQVRERHRRGTYTHTANVFTGRDEVRITLWNDGAWQVTTVHKDTMDDAKQWLESEGFQDFTA